MLDFSQIPVKLGEPKRLAALGFGIGALLLSGNVSHQWTSLFLLGLGVVATSMTIAGFLNPVTVHPGFAGGASQYGAIPAWFGKFTGDDTRAVSTPYKPAAFEQRYASHSANDVGKGRVLPTYANAYGADAIIPAGPATLGMAEVRFAAEPMYLRYVTGVENEGKIVGQGG